MTIREANLRALAASCASLIAFLGVVHEIAGPQLFPWVRDAFGPWLWHGIGVAAGVIGALLLAGTLRWIRFPIAPVAWLAAAGGAAAISYVAVVGHQFHFFALCLMSAAIATALLHSEAERIRLQQSGRSLP